MSLQTRDTAIVPAPINVPATNEFDGTDGNWSTFMINVGTPARNYRVLPCTSCSQMWVPMAGGCSESDLEFVSDCTGSRGIELFEAAPSPGYQIGNSSTGTQAGSFGLNLGYLDMASTFGTEYSQNNATYYFEDIGIGYSSGTSPPVSKSLLAAISPGNDWPWLGMFGLAVDSSTLQFSNPWESYMASLDSSGLIPSRSYGYTAGALYRKSFTARCTLRVPCLLLRQRKYQLHRHSAHLWCRSKGRTWQSCARRLRSIALSTDERIILDGS